MMFAPLEGWRHVKVTDRHAAADYAHALKDLSDLHFPDAAKIVLVQDNLSTHTPALLYATFPATEARCLVERFEWQYTPKHGSWFDMAESELGILADHVRQGGGNCGAVFTPLQAAIFGGAAASSARPAILSRLM